MEPQPCGAEPEIHRSRVMVVLCRLILQTSDLSVRLKLPRPIFLEDLPTRIYRRSWTFPVDGFLHRKISISIVRKFSGKTIPTPTFRLCTICIRRYHHVLRSSSNSGRAFSAMERETSTSYLWTCRLALTTFSVQATD